jgi:RNA-directed DNA polymerase
MKIHKNLFNQIINPENLFRSWDEFKRGKGKKIDVLEFEKDLEQHIFQLHRELRNKTYRHSHYVGFRICDPKLRNIHKATVRDRVLHHAIFKILNGVFEPTFIPTSFSCRIGKGTHKGVDSVAEMLRKESSNNTRHCYALKCDIKKFFDTVDHTILRAMLEIKITDADTLWLLEEIIEGFVSSQSDLFTRKGIPIGNLTSQLLANVYMNEFDQFMKKKLGVKHYARYTDDFVVVSKDRDYLQSLVPIVQQFLRETLALELHPEKVFIAKYSQGIDFLGYVIFPNHKLLRKRTEKRVVRKLKYRVGLHKQGTISKESLDQTLHSYMGILSHANTYRMSQELQNQYWFWLSE